jgi:hypothetical protein
LLKAGANLVIIPIDADIGRQVIHTNNTAYGGRRSQCATLKSFGANTALIAYAAAGNIATVPFTELE